MGSVTPPSLACAFPFTPGKYGCGSVCGDAWTGEIHGGGLLTNGLALEGEIWGELHGFSNPQLGAGHSALSLWTLAFQWWFADTFWVKVGIGVGRIQSNSRRVDTALVVRNILG